jgi:hypothetical protein
MEFYFLNWVQLSYDFGMVVPTSTTQGNVCWTTDKKWNKLYKSCTLALKCSKLFKIQNEHKAKQNQIKNSTLFILFGVKL